MPVPVGITPPTGLRREDDWAREASFPGSDTSEVQILVSASAGIRLSLPVRTGGDETLRGCNPTDHV